MTAATARAAREALNTRELLKVRVLDASPESPRDAAAMLAQALDDAHLVQVIGRTLIIYRPDPDHPRINLP